MPTRQQLPSPKELAAQVTLGKQRVQMAHLLFEMMEGVKADLFPNAGSWDVSSLGAVVAKVYKQNESGREATAASLARATGKSRATVQRKLHKLIKLGAVARRDHRYVIVPEYFNERLSGYARRMALIRKRAEEG
jgi:hypothetical protein